MRWGDLMCRLLGPPLLDKYLHVIFELSVQNFIYLFLKGEWVENYKAVNDKNVKFEEKMVEHR